jgi:hypothetical protein
MPKNLTAVIVLLAPAVIQIRVINPAAPPMTLTQAINPMPKNLTAVIVLLAPTVIRIRVINLVVVNIQI